MEQVFLIRGDDLGRPFRRLAYGGYLIIICKQNHLTEDLHELAKISDVVIVSADQKMNRTIADELWHPLRRKIVTSAPPGVDLSTLRDLYTLSKVCRCDLALDCDVDKCLAAASFGGSSEEDAASIKKIFSSIGEMLVINEHLFEEVRATAKRGVASLSDLMRGLDQGGFHWCILERVMCCLSQMIVKGNSPESNGGSTNPGGDLMLPSLGYMPETETNSSSQELGQPW